MAYKPDPKTVKLFSDNKAGWHFLACRASEEVLIESGRDKGRPKINPYSGKIEQVTRTWVECRVTDADTGRTFVIGKGDTEAQAMQDAAKRLALNGNPARSDTAVERLLTLDDENKQLREKIAKLEAGAAAASATEPDTNTSGDSETE